MLEIQQIRTQTETVIKGLEARFIPEASKKVHQVLELDENRQSASYYA